MAKQKISLVGAKAREEILAGVDYLANAVKLTHGPFGKNFASGVRGGPVTISNDGVSLAREIQGANEFQDIGVRAVREAAIKTNDKVGDGTTTAVILTQAILKTLGFDKDIIGGSSMKVVKKVAEESLKVVELLNAMSVPVESEEQMIEVAKVSVEDPALADLVGKAQWSVGAAGTVLAEEHNEPTDTVEYIYGVRIDNGLGTSRIANNQEKGALELFDRHIIVTNKIFNKAQDILDLQSLFGELIKGGSTGVVLVARAFDETAIGLCVKNIQMFEAGKGGFPIYPINAPYTDHDEVMEDLAAAVGAKFINSSERTMMSITTRDVGTASKVFCKLYEGIITGPKAGTDERIDEMVAKRVTHIREKLKGQISPFEKRNLEARLAQLTAGTAVIKVGAETEQERKYKMDKVTDAVNAVKAAIQDGVVAGGGVALMKVADQMPDATIVDALRAPYRQIMANAGETFDIPEWVQDPLKVVRTAFEKASSIARSLATTEVVVNWEREKPVCGGQVNMALEDQE